MIFHFPATTRMKYPSRRAEIAAAKRSLYYLWWKYLRLSEDYWWLCRFKGKSLDTDFNETYKKFGDVFAGAFDDWWLEKGAKLFAYKVKPPSVEWFDENKAYPDFKLNYKVLLVPKYLNKTDISKQISQLLENHKAARLNKKIRYDITVSDTRGMKRPVLETVYDVWSLNQVLTMHKASGKLARPERFTQYWIGTKLDVMGTKGPKSFVNIESQAKYQLTIRVKVNRYLTKARALIANAELGQFPVVKTVKKRDRWTPKQLIEIQNSRKNEIWLSPDIDQKKYIGLLQ